VLVKIFVVMLKRLTRASRFRRLRVTLWTIINRIRTIWLRGMIIWCLRTTLSKMMFRKMLSSVKSLRNKFWPKIVRWTTLDIICKRTKKRWTTLDIVWVQKKRFCKRTKKRWTTLDIVWVQKKRFCKRNKKKTRSLPNCLMTRTTNKK